MDTSGTLRSILFPFVATIVYFCAFCLGIDCGNILLKKQYVARIVVLSVEYFGMNPEKI